MIPWRKDRLYTPVFMGFPGGSDGKESTRSAGGLGLISRLGISSGGGHGNPLQYSCLENSTHRGVWWVVGYRPWSHKESDMTERLSTVQWLSSRHLPHSDRRLSCLWSSVPPGFWLRAPEVRMNRPSRLVQRWTLMSANQFPSPPPTGQPLIKEGACVHVCSAQSMRPGGEVY